MALAGAAAAAVIALALVLVLPGGSDEAYARAELWSMPAGGGAAGTAEVAEVEAGNVGGAAGAAPPREANTSCGASATTAAGSAAARSRPVRTARASAELTAAVRPGDYHVVVITRRSAEGVRGAEVMRGKLAY